MKVISEMRVVCLILLYPKKGRVVKNDQMGLFGRASKDTTVVASLDGRPTQKIIYNYTYTLLPIYLVGRPTEVLVEEMC